jgi:hypothetical protein
MSDDKEAFLSRWSRLKREDKVEKPPETPAPALPPVEKLTPESDFSGFMHPKVKEEMRRLALKKLFSDPHFNIPDPFEPYSRDFNIEDPIPPEMLAGLNQARTVLFREEEEQKQREKQVNEQKAAGEAPAVSQEGTKQDEPGRKDA